MSKLGLVVTIEFEPESKEEILRALLAHRERCLKEEPGTLQFEIMVPTEDPSKLILFELYADSSALSTHANGPSIARYRAEVGAKIKNATRYTCTLGQESAQ